ncbi:N-acyl homoserine lactonase family protein [Stutzerimonas zhaodongensis]|uniref:N-acyl homoserine lactonase family protein n=1 Tax=Stutzerimonas TaxID=2901164 RepID=UPI00388DFD15
MKQAMAIFALVASLLGGWKGAYASDDVDVRLYRPDCGTMHLGDLTLMSDSGAYKGRSYDIVVSCYLIKHGDDWLLWDTGLSKDFLGGVTSGSLKMELTKTLVEQLEALGLSPSDIDIVALSHAHFDHAGQTGDFPEATLVLQRSEYEVLLQEKVAKAHFIEPGLLQSHVSDPKLSKVKLVEGNHDLFGDGRVKMIALPGHTPGHMALELTLRNAGTVLLSGDQWHFTENRLRNQVPTFNFSHDQTLESSEKLEQLASREGVTFIIQHEPADNARLPALPGYLD